MEDIDRSIVIKAQPGRPSTRYQSFADYEKEWKASVEDPAQFWEKMAENSLSFFSPYSTVQQGSLEAGTQVWFRDGVLNASYNCIDRHASTTPDRVAILWEGNEPDEVRSITYQQLLDRVCQFANLLKACKVGKGDVVAIYMPMVPEAAMAMLACARIGAIHCVVFAGFSSEALRRRVADAKAKVVITADYGKRGPKFIPLKKVVDESIVGCDSVEHVLVYRHVEKPVTMVEGRDLWLQDHLDLQRPYCPCERMDSEDPLFVLHTSGSTGKPKGMLHTTAGYLLYAATTQRISFDYQEGDIFACVADIGWITGHSYIVYGPLCNGATTFMFESLPTYPQADRYWDMISRHKITQFYTSPTAIRTLMKFDNGMVTKHDLSSLRVIGSVGEPINPSAWNWVYEVVGKKQCAVVDTYWQTETGGHVITPLPFCSDLKPGAASYPFFGIKPVLVDLETGALIDESVRNVNGVLALQGTWPGMARTILGDHQRYQRTYLQPPAVSSSTFQAPSIPLYYTGDGVYRDEDGILWITGRIDDVINKAGHRLGSAEIESALVGSGVCSEAAVVAVPDEVKGEKIVAYCTIPASVKDTPEDIKKALVLAVRAAIGGIAVPDHIILSDALPKTRSGKIMRRLLRKLFSNPHAAIHEIGDVSTLADSNSIALLQTEVRRELGA